MLADKALAEKEIGRVVELLNARLPSEKELRGYRELVQRIASNENYALVDEDMPVTFDAKDKLLAIDKALEKYQK